MRIRGKDFQRPLDYDDIKECNLLDRCIKETLRLRPPIVTVMRMCKTPQVCRFFFQGGIAFRSLAYTFTGVVELSLSQLKGRFV